MPLTATARGTPVGIPLDDGYQSLITFAVDPDISFWEKTVDPPGRDGGTEIDVTTMHNVNYRTKAARSLIDVTPGGADVAYDPAVIDQIDAIINVETVITYKYPNGDKEIALGYLKTFKKNSLKEGEQPTARIEIVHTNRDTTTKAETGPNYISSAGTD